MSIPKTTKNKHWFPIPADLSQDRRMRRAMNDFKGGVGYGLILLLFENLRREPNYKYPLIDLDLLAKDFDVSLPILQTIIAKYGFFEVIKDENEEFFLSPLLSELMVPYDEKVEKNRIAGLKSAKNRKEKQEEQLKQLSSKTHKKEEFIKVDETPNVTF
ncbi:MAG: DUF4373 domain-containing protein [Sulfurimonas sp.]|nr:DUF4373 domain-containing protein [Sulfurimonas sp.]MDD3835480.1 DUF4373 domain-containing protein [Sulfurimonas sp.]